MALVSNAGPLRTLLFTDAITCVLSGALMAFAAGPLAAMTNIPTSLLTYAGLSLFPIAAFMGFVGVRARERLLGVWLVVAGNAAWVAASLWLLWSSGIETTPLGKALILCQAAVVVILTALEARGARSEYASV